MENKFYFIHKQINIVTTEILPDSPVFHYLLQVSQ